MDARQIQQIILRQTFTKSQYLRRLTYIREYLESCFFKNYTADFPAFMREIKASQHDHEALAVLDKHFFNLFTRDNLYPLINTLTEELKVLPVLTLYLSVLIDDYLVDELGVWFRQNLHPELIMEIHIDPTLLAGSAYVWNNRYHDLSLHYFFDQKKDIINQIIDSYVKYQV